MAGTVSGMISIVPSIVTGALSCIAGQKAPPRAPVSLAVLDDDYCRGRTLRGAGMLMYDNGSDELSYWQLAKTLASTGAKNHSPVHT